MNNITPEVIIGMIAGAIIVALIWLVNRSKSAATIKALNTELTKSQSSLNALSASYDELEKDAAEDRRLRTVAEERLAESEEARKADSDAAQAMISELRDSPRIDDKAAAIAKKTIEGLEAENGKLAAELEEAKASASGSDIEVDSRAYGFMKGSDARMRAIKKVVPKGNYNAMAKYVNDAIKAGQFAKWSNPPKAISLKK